MIVNFPNLHEMYMLDRWTGWWYGKAAAHAENDNYGAAMRTLDIALPDEADRSWYWIVGAH